MRLTDNKYSEALRLDKEVHDILVNKEVYIKLCDWENLQEDGLLFEPPCKVGDTVYFIKTSNWEPEFIETKVEKIIVKNKGLYFKLACNAMYETSASSVGKTLFFNHELAEAKYKILYENWFKVTKK